MIGKLSEIEENAVKEFNQKLRSFAGSNIKQILLFGSKARGDYHSESDIDIFVLLDQGDFETRDRIVDLAYDVFLKYQVQISPRVINMQEYQLSNRWQTSFIKNIQKEGINIG